MEKFVNWFRTNEFEISWFIVGFLTSAGFQSLGQGHWGTAIVYFIIVAVNLFLNKKKKNVAG